MQPQPSSNPLLSSVDPRGEASVLQRLRSRFAQLPDARQPGKVLHRLDEVLVCAFCATLCDADSYIDMEDFAQTQLPWLRSFLSLEHGAPSHDVFRNVFMMLQPQALLDILGQWCGPLQNQHIAIDGKTLRGTHDAQSGRALVHLLRAWVDERSLSAAQVLCEEKSNEIEAIPRLLAALELRGASVTLDAIGTQGAIAQQIHAAGADYVLALKANQKHTLQSVAAAFGQGEEPNAQRPATPAQAPTRKSETLELAHGRSERRQYELMSDLSWMAKSWKWAGLQAVGKVRREIQRSHAGEPLIEEHYYLCSFKDDIERFAALVRGHWSVENRCHWVLDVIFGEDHCQIRDRSAAHNMVIMREMSLKVLRDHPAKMSLRRKRRRAALDTSFRSQILDSLHA